MIRARLAAMIGLLLCTTGCSLVDDLFGDTPPTAPLEPADTLVYVDQVVYVVDGDTVDVQMGGDTFRVRLIGIDAPEDTTTVDCYGPEATKHLRDLLDDHPVLIELDPTQGTWDETTKTRVDRYGRTLAYLWLDVTTQVNAEMVADGFAREYTYGQVPYAHQAQIQAREDAAQAAGAGLWSTDTCDGQP